MIKSRRDFNKVALLSTGLAAFIPSKSFSTVEPTDNFVFLNKWKELYHIPPTDYLAQFDSSKNSFNKNIKEQFSNDTTVKVKGLFISHIELAVLATIETLN